MEWRHDIPKEAGRQECAVSIKIIAMGFWEEKGIIHVSFLPRKQQGSDRSAETLLSPNACLRRVCLTARSSPPPL
jgi:hypothetical protein